MVLELYASFPALVEVQLLRQMSISHAIAQKVDTP
jgi:hypothetical protein